MMVDCDTEQQAKEEESRGDIGKRLKEEKSKGVQGMVNRLTDTLAVEIIAIIDNIKQVMIMIYTIMDHG